MSSWLTTRETSPKLKTCCRDKDLFKLGTEKFDRRSPSMDVEVDMPASLMGDGSLSFSAGQGNWRLPSRRQTMLLLQRDLKCCLDRDSSG